MRRREFITLLGSTAIASPTAGLAQTFSKVYRVGLLSPLGPAADNSPFVAPLIRGLATYGYMQGRNLLFERVGAEGHPDRLPHLVEELVASRVDAINAFGYPAALAAKQGTTIPVVTTEAGDPVATGLVESLARPGGSLFVASDSGRRIRLGRRGTGTNPLGKFRRFEARLMTDLPP
jgi:putative ABC transport system substrate-binding protein